MAKTQSKKQAYALLDRLIELDYQTVEAYYDMGSIVSSMQHGKLYELIGYNSISEMVGEELTYTASTAGKYAKMYRRFRELKYLKHEAVGLLKKFGLTHMCDVLPGMVNKIGKRAIKKRIDAIDQHQINFTVTQKELDKTHAALKKLGAEQSDQGRWLNSSEAFMHMVNNVNAMNIEAETAKLKAVK